MFYQLLCATTESLPGSKRLDEHDGVPPSAITREELGLPEPAVLDQAAQFRFLAGSESFVSEGIDDIERFAEMVDTMCVIGLSTVEQQNVLRVIAGMLPGLLALFWRSVCLALRDISRNSL